MQRRTSSISLCECDEFSSSNIVNFSDISVTSSANSLLSFPCFYAVNSAARSPNSSISTFNPWTSSGRISDNEAATLAVCRISALLELRIASNSMRLTFSNRFSSRVRISSSKLRVNPSSRSTWYLNWLPAQLSKQLSVARPMFEFVCINNSLKITESEGIWL